MSERFLRTELLLGEESMKLLKNSRVAVFGLGGVGGYCAEALARGGIGALDLVDNDVISKTNINRQLYALDSTVGQYKVDVAKKRIADISPDCSVETYKTFFLPENADTFDFSHYDYVVDAVDTVSAKLCLIECAKKAGTPIISCMGTGNKLDATAFCVSDIFKTHSDALARVLRKELKKRDIDSLKVVYSPEQGCRPEPEKVQRLMQKELTADSSRRDIPGTVSFVPGVEGLITAGEVIKDILKY
ncbi:MAG: tRNA threonylcarbamoyladenosine dehydratase [Clostridia bacterium]|nr:tRNA threonylcarbamoyladenosine dehydratase [Clostridia bacterium]